jgi:hypothetical protein
MLCELYAMSIGTGLGSAPLGHEEVADCVTVAELVVALAVVVEVERDSDVEEVDNEELDVLLAVEDVLELDVLVGVGTVEVDILVVGAVELEVLLDELVEVVVVGVTLAEVVEVVTAGAMVELLDELRLVMT